MKNIFSILIAALLFTFAACSDDDLKPTASLNTPPRLTTPDDGNSYTFTADQSDDVFAPFRWTAADFGYQAAINYTLEIAKAGNNFSPSIGLGSTNGLSINDVTVGKINNLMIAAFGIADTINPTALEFRVCASVSSELPSMCSDPVTANIVPFPVVIIYDSLSVPGSYQGWDPASRENVIFSRKNDGFYNGYIYFGADDAVFKFARGWSWDENWGDTQPGDGVLEPGGIGNDIPITGTAGIYYVECDLNALTHKNEKRDWQIVGSATSADADLTWDPDRGVLTTTLDLSAGEIRFRANGDDALNLGDTFTNGLLEPDGDNIPIPSAGNYTVDLILTVGDYTYKLTKN